jgi:hypothetical protein
LQLCTIGFTVLIVAAAAQAVCGDDVDGERVACACGDVVVSDTKLLSDDPIVRNRCISDGLLVRAASDARSIRLDLAGFSIVGLGVGTGIQILDGGSEGAVILGGSEGKAATIAGFRTGLRGHGQRSVAEVRNLILTGNEADGMVLRGDGTRIVDVIAEANGRDGLRLGGRGPEIQNSHGVVNRRHDVRVTGGMSTR